MNESSINSLIQLYLNSSRFKFPGTFCEGLNLITDGFLGRLLTNFTKLLLIQIHFETNIFL